MGRAGRHLLGQDRGHHLRWRVQRERALHRDQHIVGRRELGRAAPGQAAAVLSHDGRELLEGQLHIGQHLHGVGGARRRGDRPRRGLGAQQAMRCHDGHHQHRGAVARNAADAVLVDHLRGTPVEPAAGVDHGFGQVVDLFAVELAPVGGHHKGGQLDLGIVVLRNVLHDGVKVLAPEPLAVDLAKQRFHRGRWLGLGHPGLVAVFDSQQRKRVFRQADLAAADDALVVDHIERGHHMPAVGADLHLGEGLKAFGAVDRAVAVQVDHVLAVGVDGDAPQAQRGGMAVARSGGVASRRSHPRKRGGFQGGGGGHGAGRW